MAFSSILFFLIAMAINVDSMKPTKISNFDVTTGGFEGIESITELTWNTFKKMGVKTKLTLEAKTQLLPISVYNEMYKFYMHLKQPMTRIASVALFWTPTSKRFNEMATLILMDERFRDDGIKQGKKELLAQGKLNLDLMGTVITAVPFDPNFQQFVTGSLDFATDTKDINKIKFYISFPDTRMGETQSTAGFMDLSWKTLPDENGVYENIQWNVFTFPLSLPPEVSMMSGKSNFLKVKNYLDRKYNERKEALLQLNEISNQLIWGSDQGLNKVRAKLKEDTNTSTQLLIDSEKREEAIKLRLIQDEISEAKAELSSALSGIDLNAINAAKTKLAAVLRMHNLAENIPQEMDYGYIKIGEAN
uniref:p4 n=1 Tax=Emaravirus rosae TaxID=1980433 RepID=A0A6C0VPU8_9VIRU|nr:p4 [Emaravirus rosae]QIB98132.1 p4 [Emaravirus rosae]